MNRWGFVITCCLLIGLSLSAQETKKPSGEVSISQQLYSFSPLGSIYVRELGMEDRNGNGVIDRGASEGYEEFSARYGDADTGFAANGVTYGAANCRLEEPEIVNHYYINIRFKDREVTDTIESEVSAYVYANNIPLVWLDDERGTVMNAVTRVLGAGWNEREVTEDEAVRMFYRAMDGLRIRGRTTRAANTGYYTLPEFVTRKAGYCFEVAQFGFWFFSELKINSILFRGALTSNSAHEIIEIPHIGHGIDYFGSSNRYRNINWGTLNPVQSIGSYYSVSAKEKHLAIMYDKYNIYFTYLTMNSMINSDAPDYKEIIILGNFVLQNIEAEKLINSTDLFSSYIKNYLKHICIFMLKSCGIEADFNSFRTIENFCNRYFSQDKSIKEFVDYYNRTF
jgi:hypothetical protein